jgi:hypothetical protein
MHAKRLTCTPYYRARLDYDWHMLTHVLQMAYVIKYYLIFRLYGPTAAWSHWQPSIYLYLYLKIKELTFPWFGPSSFGRPFALRLLIFVRRPQSCHRTIQIYRGRFKSVLVLFRRRVDSAPYSIAHTIFIYRRATGDQRDRDHEENYWIHLRTIDQPHKNSSRRNR